MNDSTALHIKLKKYIRSFLIFGAATVGLLIVLTQLHTYAAPGVSLDFAVTEGAEGAMGTLEILFLFLVLALAPTILLMMTSFTRIVIVLSFLRNALGTQQSPPNQIIIGLALFLTLFVMTPVVEDIRTNAYDPYRQGVLTEQEAVDAALDPMKEFMLRQTDKKTLNLFLSISNGDAYLPVGEQATIESLTDLGLEIVVPSFITSELKRAFTIGFLLFLPFLIIDMVVSSILMSMGMVMLPPAMIALPFKIMMFVLVDGWSLLMGTLVRGFR